MRTSDHQERWLLRLVKRVFEQEILSGSGRFAPGPETGQGLVLVLKVEITSRRRRTLSPSAATLDVGISRRHPGLAATCTSQR